MPIDYDVRLDNYDEVKASLISKDPSVERLSFYGSDITQEQYVELIKLLPGTNVAKLYFAAVDIGQEAEKELAKVLPKTNVTDLEVGNAPLSLEGAKAIAEALPNTKITELRLSKNGLGPEGVKAIAGVLPNTKITKLDLSDNKPGLEGTKAIAEALPKTEITSLTFWEDEGTKVFEELFESFSKSKKLTSLDLFPREISLDPLIQKLIDVLPHTNIQELSVPTLYQYGNYEKQVNKVIENNKEKEEIYLSEASRENHRPLEKSLHALTSNIVNGEFERISENLGKVDAELSKLDNLAKSGVILTESLEKVRNELSQDEISKSGVISAKSLEKVKEGLAELGKFSEFSETISESLKTINNEISKSEVMSDKSLKIVNDELSKLDDVTKVIPYATHKTVEYYLGHFKDLEFSSNTIGSKDRVNEEGVGAGELISTYEEFSNGKAVSKELKYFIDEVKHAKAKFDESKIGGLETKFAHLSDEDHKALENISKEIKSSTVAFTEGHSVASPKSSPTVKKQSSSSRNI